MKQKFKVALSEGKLKLKELQQHGNYKELFHIDFLIVGCSGLILTIGFYLAILLT